MSQRLTTPLPRVSWRISDKRWLCSQANCGSSACHLSSYKPTIYNNTLKALRSSCIRKYVIPISYRVVLGSKADLEFTIFLPQPSKFCFIFLTKKKGECVYESVCVHTHMWRSEVGSPFYHVGSRGTELITLVTSTFTH